MEYKKHSRNKPYMARNKIVKKTEVLPELPLLNENQLPSQQLPTQEPKVSEGFVNVGVYTALGALPVKDAVVTLYITDEHGEEHALYHLVTDQNGRVPKMTLPVIYNPENPNESAEYFFSTYNLRVQAIGYYTQNILDLRVFPDTATNYNINLIPVKLGGTEEESRTLVIPPSPIDKSNE